jgi:hypothetical protein
MAPSDAAHPVTTAIQSGIGRAFGVSRTYQATLRETGVPDAATDHAAPGVAVLDIAGKEAIACDPFAYSSPVRIAGAP